ncbi:MAG TPA: hypothetical protein VHQ46_01480 [Desulfobacteria bacterium]|nr:hypothetical protein [Desulfobacteria bacterium]
MAKQSSDTGSPTPYWLDDPPDKVYLTDNDPDVVAVTLTAWEFAQLINNRDYTSLDSSVEYHLYTAGYRQELVRKKDPKRTAKYFKSNKIKSSCPDSTLVSLRFSNKLSEAEITYAVKIVVTAATDKYFKSMNNKLEGKQLAKNVPYEQLYMLHLVKEAGMWKIDYFEADSIITVL